MTSYQYNGPDVRTYPFHLHPEDEARPVLSVEPGEIVDFGEAQPPDDGLWLQPGKKKGDWVPYVAPVAEDEAADAPSATAENVAT